MPRKARDERLDTRATRLRLTPRREPYWRTIQEGRAIGYRRLTGGKAGSWIARHYDPVEGRQYRALGSADDMLDADGMGTLTFAQAQDRARDWFREVERCAGRALEAITVRQAMSAYVEDYRTRGGKALAELQSTINAHILPELGDRRVATLTYAQIKAWHQRLAQSPALLRTKASAQARNVRSIDPGDTEGRRARRSTANRILTVLKAALNLAYRDGRAPSDDAWRRVKPFAKADAPRIRYLTDAEVTRLVNAGSADLRRLITAAVLTGCRYAELARLWAADLDLKAGVLHIRTSKSGKSRSAVLTDEGRRFFAGLARGKPHDALLLSREGRAWGKSHQHRLLREACEIAQITPAVSFHILRHTFASRLVMRGVPMAVVAAALGNTETICARHYAHLSPGYIADTIRQATGELGIVPGETNVQPLRLRAQLG
jgi:site-specific recombinase XerD